MFQCTKCNKSFDNQRGLTGHSRMHGPSNGTIHQFRCCCIITRREVNSSYLSTYQSKIQYCNQCNSPLDSYRQFCDTSCAAKFNNAERCKSGWRRTEESKRKTSESVNKSLVERGYLKVTPHTETGETNKMRHFYTKKNKYSAGPIFKNTSMHLLAL